MAKVSKQSAAQVERHGPVENHHEDVHGYAIDFLSFSEDIDATPLMKGLPDEKCQCPHWGYVFKGRLTFRFADHDEVVEAGDAFYLPPGHVPIVEAGTEYLQFSPSEELRTVSDAIKANMQRMMQSA
jgi:hypothetical protein